MFRQALLRQAPIGLPSSVGSSVMRAQPMKLSSARSGSMLRTGVLARTLVSSSRSTPAARPSVLRIVPSFRSQTHLLTQTRSISIPRLIPPGTGFLGFLSRLVLSSIVGVGALLGVILLHDSFTYNERHIDRVPTSPLAMHPRTGGPKNLPIVDSDLGSEEDEVMKGLTGKPKLLIVGGGWGAVALLKQLPANEYNVTLVSPDNFNLFTPLLPSACVGTVEPRSLVEPLRKLLARVRGHYMTGKAMDVEMSERLLEVEVAKDEKGGTTRCYIPYDKLIIAVGSTTNDHGVPGLEHCFQLKTIPDAQNIRRRIMTNLELASLPTTSPEERKRLLSFIVCGGGPTGVEFAAELADMMEEDVMDYFPKLLRAEMSVKVIQSRDHILNTYSEKISQYAEKRFERQDIEVIRNARVGEVFEDRVTISIKDPKGTKDAKAVIRDLPAGFVLWSTGIAMNPFVRTLVNKLPNQSHKKAIVVDDHLRVRGSPINTVYAVGDASTIDTNLVDYLMDLFEEADVDHDNKLNYAEWEKLAARIKGRFPLAAPHFEKAKEIFLEYDTDKDSSLSLNDVAQLFQNLSHKVTTLPATAQVASQQGAYLGRKFAKLAKRHPARQAEGLSDPDDEEMYKPFKYLHLGSLAYVGNSAVFDMNGYSFMGGLIAMYAWRSIYWSEQTSMRTRVLLMVDWIKRGVFGRDLSKF